MRALWSWEMSKRSEIRDMGEREDVVWLVFTLHAISSPAIIWQSVDVTSDTYPRWPL